MSQAVISVKKNTREDDMVKMFEEILKEKLDAIFQQKSNISSHPFGLSETEVPLSCRSALHGPVVLSDSHR